MKNILLLAILFSITTITSAQNEWVLQRWTKADGDTNHQQLGLHVGYLGKKGDTTIVSVTEANEVIKVYYIKTPADTIPRFTLKGINCTTGDFNGDGIKDLLVNGNPTRIYLGLSAGVYDTIPFFKKYQEPDGYSFGNSAVKGNFNNDQYDDIIISDYGYPNGDFYGRVYLFFGGIKMDSTIDCTFTGDSLSQLGYYIASGDLNGDGFDEIIARGYNYIKDIGYIKIYLGGNYIDTLPWKYLTGSRDLRDMASFDTDGDKVDDLIWSNIDSLKSTVYIHFGKSEIDSLPNLKLKNPGVGGLGDVISNGGDLNGDGHNDIVTGAYQADPVTGYVFVYSGGPKLDANFDASVGKEQVSHFGYSIAGIGDINGDGYDDILVGAPAAEWFAEKGYWAIFLGNKNIPPVSVSDSGIVYPEDFQLLQNYPNPFNPSTKINYEVSAQGRVKIIVYDLLGREAAVLVDNEMPAGAYEIEFNADNSGLSSGVYFIKMDVLQSNRVVYSRTRKINLLK